MAFGSGQRLALREKLQQGADHPACGAPCARFRLRVLQAETMRQSGHAAGKVARVHGKRDGLGFEEAFEDSRQGACLLILQRVISFCEHGISARVELQLCNQERTVAIAVHCFEPCAQRRGQLVRGETDDPPKQLQCDVEGIYAFELFESTADLRGGAFRTMSLLLLNGADSCSK